MKIEKGKLGRVRLWSTPESANNLEFSSLALLESLVACALSLFIAWKLEAYTHLIVAIILAPWLLLRTDDSVKKGLVWFDTFIRIDWTREFSDNIFQGRLAGAGVTLRFLVLVPGTITIVTVVSVGTGLAALSCKLVATTLESLNHPARAVCFIPQNWFRVVFSTDFKCPAEIMPGIETCEPEYAREFRYSELGTSFGKDKKEVPNWAIALLGAILFLPALIFRWSLKSTFIFYLPLLWISNNASGIISNDQGYSKDQILAANLERESKGVLASIKLIYAGIIGIVTLGSVAASFMIEHWTTLLTNHNQFLSRWIDYWLFSVTGQMADALVTDVVTIDSWHITRILAAVITVGLFIYAQQTLVTRTRLTGYRNVSAPLVLFWLRFLRSTFGLFTLGCGFYLIVWPSMKGWEWMKVVICWLPGNC